MADELDLDELEKICSHLHITEDRSGSAFIFYHFDGVNQAQSLTLDEMEKIKQALPVLIEIARTKRLQDSDWDDRD